LKRFIVLSALLTLAACGGDSSTSGSSSIGGTLQIEELIIGTGATAAVGDTVSVHYTGRFTNGTVFDTSAGRAPFQFRLGANQVIPGFEQGIVGMKVGGRRRLTIPPSLAYGSTGSGSIPPNTTIVFDVDLVSIP
jgi:FKBP-type peptidyl-prolyl cis-trans isomerase FkpA